MPRTHFLSARTLSRPTGLEVTVRQVAESKPIRQEQKLETLRRYIEKHPSGWKKRLEAAMLLFQAGRWEEAAAEYRAVILQRPIECGARLALAKIYEFQDRLHDAEDEYQQALALVAEAATKHHIQGMLDACRGKKRSAIASFEAAARSSQRSSSVVASLLGLARQQFHYDIMNGALDSLGQLLSIEPENVPALLLRHSAERLEGHLVQADATLLLLEQLAPENPYVLAKQIEDRCTKRLLEGAEGKRTRRLLSTLLAEQPESMEAKRIEILFFAASNRLATAIETTERLVQMHSANPMAWHLLAQCRFWSADLDVAAEAIAEAIRLEPNDRRKYEVALAINSERKDRSAVRSLMNEMLLRFNEHWSILATLSRVSVEHDLEIQSGLELGNKALSLYSSSPLPWFALARTAMVAGKAALAEEAFLEAFALVNDTANQYHSIGASIWYAELLKTLGRQHEAIQWFKQGMSLAADIIRFDPSIGYYWLGRSELGLYYHSQAEQSFSRALEMIHTYPLRPYIEQWHRAADSILFKKYH